MSNNFYNKYKNLFGMEQVHLIRMPRPYPVNQQIIFSKNFIKNLPLTSSRIPNLASTKIQKTTIILLLNQNLMSTRNNLMKSSLITLRDIRINLIQIQDIYTKKMKEEITQKTFMFTTKNNPFCRRIQIKFREIIIDLINPLQFLRHL
jgi:hypothetical protein